jgi:hypothetical protein
MSLVDFVFQILINCGKSEIVVNTAAVKPIIVMKSIMFLSFTVSYTVFMFRFKRQYSNENRNNSRFALTVDDTFWKGRFK